SLFLSRFPYPPTSQPFPYTTLFRSPNVAAVRPEMIADRRQTGINVAEIERRVSEVERLRIRLSLDQDRPFIPRNGVENDPVRILDRKSTRLNSSHSQISYAVFCMKK